ncbi:MAG TPA: galactokinase [Anaerolineae bacterium]|nr:galactokinase [Anaerolineae bacterium]
MSLQNHVVHAFQTRFGQPPAFVARAPGRVNLIGEHTDYNDGFVLPMAIDRAVWIALRPRQDGKVHVHSLDLDRSATFDLADLRYDDAGWAEYVKGVAWALQEAGYSLAGWEGVLAGDVPRGAGLSSSAAVELATARAFQAVSGFTWDPPLMARLGQKAENQWVGMNCGIMDQMISAAGQADHALLIDCRSLETTSVPLPPGTVVVILDTATRRGLVDSAYNERRAQCEAAAAFFGVPALRDVSMERFAAEAGGLGDVTMRRARHIISENARTLAAAEAMQRGDAVELGRLMDASHVSMRDDFEISGPALNIMVECAQGEPGCFGARMTGGGFAGCAVALVDAERAPAFADSVAARYQARANLTPAVYVCSASEGASIVG